MTGRRVGNYLLWERIGAGPTGEVFRARGIDGRDYAVKVVHPHLASDPAVVERFRTQTAFAATLQNKGFDKTKDRTGRMRWRGLGLTAEDAP